MEQRTHKVAWKPLLVASLLALVVHLELVLTDLLPAMYRFWAGLFPQKEIDKVTEVTMVAMTPQQFEQNRQIRQRAKVEQKELEQEKPKPTEPEKPEDLKGQVVDVAPTPDSTPPKDARFLSEHNTNVERETVSRQQRWDYGVAQPKPTVADSSRKRLEKPQEHEGGDRVALHTRKSGERRATSDQKSFAFEIPDLKKRESLDLKLDLSMGDLATYKSSEALSGNSDRLRMQLGRAKAAEEAESGEHGEDDQTVAMFKPPSLDQLDMVTGAPANDHIEDVAKGEQTLLNTREFKYATFFNRVKRGVSQYWGPRVGEEYLRRDPYGNIYGVKDRHTLLSVSLDPDGGLLDVAVTRSSGVRFFDDVAIQSFRDASPFPNPPEGLVEADGKIHFQFGFYFMIGERPTMRAFQYRHRPF